LNSFLPDLQSRLSLLSVFKLPVWSDADFETLLVRLADARGLSFTPEVARVLGLRIRRTPADAERIIRSIDESSLVEQRAPTIPFLKTLGY
jgi:chromosomal replication initiation ATPase DnaA